MTTQSKVKAYTIMEIADAHGVERKRLGKTLPYIPGFPESCGRQGSKKLYPTAEVDAFLQKVDLLSAVRTAETIIRSPEKPISPIRLMALDFLTGKYSPKFNQRGAA